MFTISLKLTIVALSYWIKKMSMPSKVQESFLALLSHEQIPVAVYLLNGIKLQGLFLAITEHAILLQHTFNQWVHKKAISIITLLETNNQN